MLPRHHLPGPHARACLRDSTVLREREDESFGPADIIVTPTVPADLRVTAGLITAQLQTPLCHVGLLCSNRATPNCAVLAPLLEQQVLPLLGKPVFLRVGADGLHIEQVSAELCAAVAARNIPANAAAVAMRCPKALTGGFPRGLVLPAASLWHMPGYGSQFVGAKAANCAQIGELLGERQGEADAFLAVLCLLGSCRPVRCGLFGGAAAHADRETSDTPGDSWHPPVISTSTPECCGSGP